MTMLLRLASDEISNKISWCMLEPPTTFDVISDFPIRYIRASFQVWPVVSHIYWFNATLKVGANQISLNAGPNPTVTTHTFKLLRSLSHVPPLAQDM